jgi:hypothetical protein
MRWGDSTSKILSNKHSENKIDNISKNCQEKPIKPDPYSLNIFLNNKISKKFVLKLNKTKIILEFKFN